MLLSLLLFQVKASLRQLPNAEVNLRHAEAACFQARQCEVVQQQETATDIMSPHLAEAQKALQMLLLLLDFPLS